MSPEVTAAIIAASVSVLTLIGTLAAQYFGRRATSRDTQEDIRRTHEQLDKTLAAQGKQLDRTLEEQRTRTLINHRRRPAWAGRAALAAGDSAAVLRGSMPPCWRSPATWSARRYSIGANTE